MTTILQDDLRMLLRGEVIWQKQRGASGSCAWGSYQSPANPVLRDTTERLLIASKGRFEEMRDFFEGVGTGDKAGIWQDLPKERPEFRKQQLVQLAKRRKSEEPIGC